MTAASSRIPQTSVSTAPLTRRTLQRPPVSSFQTFIPPQLPSSSSAPPPKRPQAALTSARYPENTRASTTARPQDWSQILPVPSHKPQRPAINTAMPKTQEEQLWLGEKHKSAKEGNQVFKTSRGRDRGEGKRNRRRRIRPGSVRLMSPDGLSDRGRVEIYISGQWGTVCDDLFTSKAGTVVCRQLGFTTALAVMKRAALGAADSSVGILLDDVECEGGERSLLECKRAKVGQHNCSHREDVGVICG